MSENKVKLVDKTKKAKKDKPERKVRFIMKPREKKREFPFTDDDFLTLSDLVHQKTGIVLKNHKKDMVYGRLARRLRKLGIQSFSDYLHYLGGAKGESEISGLINAITTNLTRFFREPHHFDHLSGMVLPEALNAIRSGRQDRLRIWSAGCSSGEEPYSIAMQLDRAIKERGLDGIDAKILATDLDTNMLERGRKGDYQKRHFESLPEEYHNYLEEIPTQDDRLHVATELRRYISYKQLNLLGEWPMKGPFDAIFCRNVMIYFDNKDKLALTNRLVDLLKPGGWLFIGHSETILTAEHSLELYGRTIYRKKS
ncbi:protein-glutamate O-methyltransferase CheR [Terasakiella sp. A23]|uniref:CheR family methyltransferase n=1 Tax=Terasakiella sp. FCG-A23 TaxID=3080561 RepID=UPI0029541B86|nr:protein-glutamate O-methyltransferase CheR [Terasakiella sp. A23]MDV7338694.1 protein-glutamate O-methyltransferase CheR [Terasakiella sp. A23]